MEQNAIIYVVSDALGETGETVSRAAISQFPLEKMHVIRIPNIRDKKQIDTFFEQMDSEQAIIVYTLISPVLREYLAIKSKKKGIYAVDLMGPMITGLKTIATSPPSLEPGLVHRLDHEYFKKVNAVEFAVKYDDGKNPQGYLHADVVLIGVSRTSKTPLSMYLGNKKIKAANLPLEPEVPLPPEIFQIPPYRIIGLTVDKDKLSSIRSERLKAIGLQPQSKYSNVQRIEDELTYAYGIMRQLHCKVIDVTNCAIEETASIIMDIVEKNKIRYK